MRQACRPQVHQVFLLDRISLMPSGIQGSLHPDRVPDNHGMSQEIQTGRLMALPFLVLLAHNALACKEEKFAQIMQFLAFVELGTNAMTQDAIFQIAQHYVEYPLPSVG